MSIYNIDIISLILIVLINITNSINGTFLIILILYFYKISFFALFIFIFSNF